MMEMMAPEQRMRHEAALQRKREQEDQLEKLREELVALKADFQVLEARYLQLRDVLLPSEMDIALEKIRIEHEKNAQFEANQLKKLLLIEALLKERIQHQ